MQKPGSDWENLYLGAGADKMILTGFKNEALKPLTGKTLAEVAAMLGTSDSQVRNMVARGQLVKPLKVPGLGLRWRVEAVRAWLENLERGAAT